MVQKNKLLWFLLLLAVFGSGAAALGYQLLWTRRMVDLLGGSAEAVARIFGVFFLGLAFGSWLGGRTSGYLKSPWRTLAILEGVIALWILPFVFLHEGTAWIWPALGPDHLEGWLGSLTFWMLSLGLILPPTVAMGCFLPVLLQAIGKEPCGKVPLTFYAVNTLGGVAGISGMILWLLPVMGVVPALGFLAFWNILCVLFFGSLAYEQRLKVRMTEQPRPQNDCVSDLKPKWILMAAGSGFLLLATEICLLASIQLAAPLSFYGVSAVLAVVILTLGIGAWLVAKMGSSLSIVCLGTLLIAAGVGLAIFPFLLLESLNFWPLISTGTPAWRFWIKLAGLTLALSGLPLLIFGLWFPWVLQRIGQQASLPRQWGVLLAVNGLGGFLGAELAYRVLLPTLGPFGALSFLGTAYAFAAVWILPHTLSTRSWLMRLGPVILLVMLTGWTSRNLPTVNPGLASLVVEEKHGREGSVAVIESPTEGRTILVANQYFLGSSSAEPQQARQAHLPLALHENPKEVAFLGVATGITPGAALDDERVHSLTAVEISSAVAEIARQWFAKENRGLFSDPRAKIVVEDGRTWFAANVERFDVVVGDLFLPWGPGEGRLYSREHFQAVRNSLNEGGLFCQWLPLYQLTWHQFAVIANTFLTVFGEMAIYHRAVGSNDPVVALVGSKGPLPGTLHHPEKLNERHDHYLLGIFQAGWLDVPQNTLLNLWIEKDASRHYLSDPRGNSYLKGSAWESFLMTIRQPPGESPAIPDP
jgi:spermidine synthase